MFHCSKKNVCLMFINICLIFYKSVSNLLSQSRKLLTAYGYLRDPCQQWISSWLQITSQGIWVENQLVHNDVEWKMSTAIYMDVNR